MNNILLIGALLAAHYAIAQPKPLNVKGVKIGTIKESLDTAIRVNPKMVYLSYEIENLSSVTLAEVMSGVETAVVTNAQGNIIPIKDKILHKVSSAIGTNVVNYVVKIPFRLKTEKDVRKVYFKWAGPDKIKMIELTATR